MKAWQLTAPGIAEPLTLVTLPQPEPGPGEVVVRVRAAALNPYDLVFIYQSRQRPDFVPYVPGVDAAGTVDGIGEGVTGWAEGSAVIVDPWVSCGECEACRLGHLSDCPQGYSVSGHSGGPRTGGAFAQYMKVPARNLIPAPPHLSFAEAAALPTVLATTWEAMVGLGLARRS